MSATERQVCHQCSPGSHVHKLTPQLFVEACLQHSIKTVHMH